MKKRLSLLAAVLMTAIAGFAQGGLFNNGQQPVASSSPDGYGYTWVYDTSNYDWVDIETIGTKVSGLTDDNYVGPIPMGMNFQYYWETKSQVYIGSNGYISFSPVNIASGTDGFPNAPVSSDAFSDFIAPMMCDLKLDGSGNISKVYYYYDAVANRFIVSFIDVAFWKNAPLPAKPFTGANTFQIILNGSDSTIVFNYKAQSGSWDTSYDTRPFPNVVAIENSTGQYGIGISPTETNGKYKPRTGDCITFYQPASALVTVKDIGPVSVQNTYSEGVFMVAQKDSTDPDFVPLYDLKATVGNLGNTALTENITILATVADTTGFAYVTDTLRLDSMAANERREITFPSSYTPQFVETTFSYPFTYTVETLMGADINGDNNKIAIELVVLDTIGGTAYMDYVSSDNANVTGAVNWSGGAGNSGGGVLMYPIGYPATITAIDVRPIALTATDTNPIAYYLEVWSANSDGTPADLLQRDTVLFTEVVANQNPTTLWALHELSTPVQIDSNGFFISWIQQRESIGLATEERTPISRRTWEILDGSWAPYRDRNNTDYWLRAVVDVSKVWKVGVEQYVPVENLILAPNPATEQVSLSFDLVGSQDVLVRMTDVQGRKVFMNFVGGVSAFAQTIDVSALPAGIYFVEIVSHSGVISRKLVVE